MKKVRRFTVLIRALILALPMLVSLNPAVAQISYKITNWSLIPDKPVTGEDVRIHIYSTFNSGACGFNNISVSEVDSVISIKADPFVGMAAYICQHSDTITLGSLTAGYKNIFFNNEYLGTIFIADTEPVVPGDTITPPLPTCAAYFQYTPIPQDSNIWVDIVTYFYEFQDLSKGTPVSWLWNFGDGQTSKEQNPVHTFMKSKPYTVSLTIQTAEGCSSTYTTYIGDTSVTPPPHDSMYCEHKGVVSDITKCGPLITLENGTTIIPLGSKYDSLLTLNMKVQVSYTVPKIYLSCKATPAELTCLHIENNIPERCKASFSYYNMGCALSYAECIGFNDESTGGTISWNWNLGDGYFTNVQNPQHIYKPGTYEVCLTTTASNGCSTFYCSYITVGNANPSYCKQTGTVKDMTGLDGCGYVIVLDNGETIEPILKGIDFKMYNGQRVRLSIAQDSIMPMMASICMMGRIAFVTCIEEIGMEPCKPIIQPYVLTTLEYPQKSGNTYSVSFSNTNYCDSVISVMWYFGNNDSTGTTRPVKEFQFDKEYSICVLAKTADGNEIKTCNVMKNGLLLENTTGTDDEQASAINVYPNPASDRTTFVIPSEISGNLSISITDMTGRLVSITYNGSVTNGGVIQSDLSDIQAGNYIYTIKTNDKIIQGRLMIIK